MKQQAVIMDMPVTVNIVDAAAQAADIDDVMQYFHHVDATFSTFKDDSEISKINRGEITQAADYSADMRHVLDLCEQTRQITDGYFDIHINGRLDLAGLVKGYAIHRGAEKLRAKGFQNYYVEIGGDIQVHGRNEKNQPWALGIKNPFNHAENVKVLYVTDRGVATSGTYLRGHHIYDPVHKKEADDIVSLTVIGPNIYEADRFATPAFAMGLPGLEWLEEQPGLEGYMITKDRTAYATSGFDQYLVAPKNS